MSVSQEQTRFQVVVFRLDQHDFAVPVEQVWRVEPLLGQTITRVPRAPAFLEGVINVRGQVIPVLDLKKRLDFPLGERPPKPRILIVEVDQQRVGMIVDAVTDIPWCAAADVEAPPPMVAQINGIFVRGIAKEDERLLIILNLNETLNPAERKELEEMESVGEQIEEQDQDKD